MSKYDPSATTSATKLAKIVAKPIYSLVGDLHGMQVVRSSSLLGSIEFHNRKEINPIASNFA